jgi:hypothetical protein
MKNAIFIGITKCEALESKKGRKCPSKAKVGHKIKKKQ